VPRFPDSVLVGIEAVINTFPMVMGKRSEPEIVTIIEQSKKSSQNEGISNQKNIPERITSGSVPTKNLASPRPPGRLDSLSFGKKTLDSGSELQSWAEKSSPKQMNKLMLSKFGTDDLGLSLDSEPTRNKQKFIDRLVKGHDLTIQELEAKNLKNEEKILQLTQQIDTRKMIPQMSETPNQPNQNSIPDRSHSLEYSRKTSGVASTMRSPLGKNRQRTSIEYGRIALLHSDKNFSLPRSDTPRAPFNPASPSMVDFLSEPPSTQFSLVEEDRDVAQDIPMGTGQKDSQLGTRLRVNSDITQISEIQTTKKKIKANPNSHLVKLDMKKIIRTTDLSSKTLHPRRGLLIGKEMMSSDGNLSPMTHLESRETLRATAVEIDSHIWNLLATKVGDHGNFSSPETQGMLRSLMN
jgi:hypothetical protein